MDKKQKLAQKKPLSMNGLKPHAEFLFEVSWEVCNKVGGIYSVLTSKAALMNKYYKGRYILIGPYFEQRVKGEFQECPPSKAYENVFGQLKKEGITCHFGNWLVKGEPFVILIDFKEAWKEVNTIKRALWDDFSVDSLYSGYDFDEPLVWAHSVGKVVEKFVALFKGKRLVAQFHEWLSGAGLLYLKEHGVPIGTVFTTHATTLGRTLAFHNIDFYSRFKEINPDEKARELHVHEKHQLEKQAALHATIFTTVSEITGLEAEHFLGRKPGVILPNGLDANQFLNFEEIAWKHQVQRNRLREFLFSYFFPYYTFDLEETLFYFIASRYEFRAKGIGLFINALALLNKRLVETKSKNTVVVFFWVPSQVKQVNPELLENRELYQDVRDYLEETSHETKERLLYTIMEGKRLNDKTMFQEDVLFEIKKRILKFKREGTPPLATHYLTNPHDQILRAFVQAGLDNKKSDRVKVIFYPVYLSGHDGLTNLNYFESIQASHFGIFPSLYEPWGYTPLETAAFGVASLTLTLSGFGQFCHKFVKGKKSPGIFVLEGFDKSDETLVEEMGDVLYRFSQFSRRERIENKIQARKVAALADWKALIKNYIIAHNSAVEK